MRIIILINFLLLINFCTAQNQGEMEYRLITLQDLEIKKTAQRDSLNTVLEQAALKIDEEKGRKIPDQNKITKMMARALTITQKVKDKEKELQELDLQISNLTSELDSVYTATIDSLEKMIMLSRSDKEKDNLKKRMYLLSSKRFLLLPSLYALSFDTRKISEINFKSSDTSLEFIIYKEYLDNARNEIVNYLNELKKVKSDLLLVNNLHKETADFLEDIRDENNWDFIQGANAGKSGEVYGGSGSDAINFPFSSNFYHRFIGFNRLLSQLDGNQNDFYTGINPLISDTSIVQISIEEYIKLIDKLENKLKNVDFVIENKLRQIK